VAKKHPTLKELYGKKYPFTDLDLSRMLDNILGKGIIELPKPKRRDELGRANDPK